MKKRIVLTSISLLLVWIILLTAETVSAFQFYWTSVQYRAYANGSKIYKVLFQIQNDQNEFVTNEDTVTNVVLKTSAGDPLELGSLEFAACQALYAGFYTDANHMCWIYNTSFFESTFGCTINNALVPDNYTLEVTTITGPLLTIVRPYDYFLELPIVSQESFDIHSDSAGNIYWKWDIPKDLKTLSDTHVMSYRTMIDFYYEGNLIGYLWNVVPVYMGFTYIPQNIYQEFLNLSPNEARFSIQARTNDNMTRSYSREIIISDPSSPIAVVKKLDIEDAIYTLQVLSNNR